MSGMRKVPCNDMDQTRNQFLDFGTEGCLAGPRRPRQPNLHDTAAIVHARINVVQQRLSFTHQNDSVVMFRQELDGSYEDIDALGPHGRDAEVFSEPVNRNQGKAASYSSSTRNVAKAHLVE